MKYGSFASCWIPLALAVRPLQPPLPPAPASSPFQPDFFLKKAIFITLATYAFIPVMSLHDHNKLGAYTYAGLLIGIHVLFIIIYMYRVKFTQLDYERKGLLSRVLGLLFCVMLLGLVSESLEKDDLSILALEVREVPQYLRRIVRTLCSTY